MKKIEELACYNVLKFFEQINKIPRGSGNEKEISNFLADFARKRSFDVIQDSVYNIIIKKPASKGFENSKPIIIQGHMDMVCEKESSSNHDFKKDPINVIYENGFMRANKTTLGADDGIAVAMGLAILDDDTILHPPLEIIFTVDEEIGMLGAESLDSSLLNGNTLINIDSEEEGIFVVSCAGGTKVHSHIPIKYNNSNNLFSSYSLVINGLDGGHSGIEIIKQKANANVLMARVIYSLIEDFGIKLSYISGGAKDNAIPREAEAIISFSDNDYNAILERINNFKNDFKNEFINSDSKIDIKVNKIENAKRYFDDSIAKNIVSLILLIPNGVQTMSMNIKELVESSNNIGVVSTSEDEVTIVCAVRSSVPSLKNLIYNKIYSASVLAGGSISSIGDYPAWEYKKESKLRELFINEYRNMFSKEPKLDIIHAGLECGIFAKKIPDIDAISFGPNLYDIHTPKERADLMSIERTWLFLLSVLKKLK